MSLFTKNKNTKPTMSKLNKEIVNQKYVAEFLDTHGSTMATLTKSGTNKEYYQTGKSVILGIIKDNKHAIPTDNDEVFITIYNVDTFTIRKIS